MANEFIANKKILVVEAIEDDTFLRGVMDEKLKLEGYSVLQARDGEEGLEIALAKKPDLVILDIVMPKMDGLTVMEKLRAQGEWGKNLPIVLFTNLNADDEKIIKAIENNQPTYYLVKSNNTINDLIEKIKERLSK
ncbi:MAG: response regulator [Candidatus Paceibacterota bacterium]|jgi:CheY-like chemotaxis protein